MGVVKSIHKRRSRELLQLRKKVAEYEKLKPFFGVPVTKPIYPVVAKKAHQYCVVVYADPTMRYSFMDDGEITTILKDKAVHNILQSAFVNPADFGIDLQEFRDFSGNISSVRAYIEVLK